MSLYVNVEGVNAAVAKIEDVKKNIATAGTTLISDLNNALSTAEGDSIAALKLKIGTTAGNSENSFAYFAENQVPGLIDGLRALLEENLKAFQNTDTTLADNINPKN